MLRAFVHHKHVDYYDVTTFSRAYDWMKARGMSEARASTPRWSLAEDLRIERGAGLDTGPGVFLTQRFS
jgi:hypothetical protein